MDKEPFGPATVQMQLSMVKLAVSLLVEAAQDLRAAVDAEYPESRRKAYPALQRKYERDLQVVIACEDAADAMAKAANLSGIDGPKSKQATDRKCSFCGSDDMKPEYDGDDGAIQMCGSCGKRTMFPELAPPLYAVSSSWLRR